MQDTIEQILRGAAISTRKYLAQLLPNIRADWWTALVVVNLTESQQRILKAKNSDSLDSLDLAALPRAFNYNFDDTPGQLSRPRGKTRTGGNSSSVSGNRGVFLVAKKRASTSTRTGASQIAQAQSTKCELRFQGSFA